MKFDKNIANRAAIASLILGRVVYAINWVNIAVVFSPIASEFQLDVSGLGLVMAAFYIGIGAFQLPGGILAAKMGPRLTVIYGTTIASVSALLTAFARNLVDIVFLRLLVGAGMALVFAPAVVLMIRLLGEGSEGLGIGTYNSAFQLGGVLGLSGWAAIAVGLGWRGSLVLSGSLGLVTSLSLVLFVPGDDLHSDFQIDLHDLKLMLSNRLLLVLSIALLGFHVGGDVVRNFMAYYLEGMCNVGVGEAGVVASLAVASAFATGPFSGKAFDRFGNAKWLFLITGAAMAVGTGIASIGTLYSAIASSVLVGLTSGAGLTFGFAAAREANRLGSKYDTLAISWVNSLSLFGSFMPPLLFSHFVTWFGYGYAWLCIALLAFSLILPVLFSKLRSRQREECTSTSA
jgi:MFS family permease